MFEKNQYVQSLLLGKKVALVGTSKHLQGMSLGEKIDSYDVVARVGELYPLNAEKDYGSRTDIFFNSFNIHAPSQIKYEFDRLATQNKQLELKCVVCPQKTHDDSGAAVYDNFWKVEKLRGVYWCQISNTFYWDYYTLIKTKPNTGLMSMIFLSNYSKLELFLAGFSFYSQGIYSSDCYRDGYVGVTHPLNPTGHFQPSQVSYFKNHIKVLPGVTMDPFMEQIL